MHGWRLLITKWKSWKNIPILQHFFFSGAIFSKNLRLTSNVYQVENTPNWPWHPQRGLKWVGCIQLWEKDRWVSCAVMFLGEAYTLLNRSDQAVIFNNDKETTFRSIKTSFHSPSSFTQLQPLSQWFIIQSFFFQPISLSVKDKWSTHLTYLKLYWIVTIMFLKIIKTYGNL